MKALVVYYSLTGQAAIAADLAAKTLIESGAEVTMCRIDFADPAVRPRRPFSLADVKRWSDTAAAGTTFPLSLDPPNALEASYDLVVLFSNTWQHHPSTPIRSLLTLPAMHRVLNGTPFATFVVSRLLWEKNASIVQQEAEAVGGICIDTDHFGHNGGSISSLFTTVIYMLTSGPRVMWPLPKFGLSSEALSRVPLATRRVIEKAREWQQKRA